MVVIVMEALANGLLGLAVFALIPAGITAHARGTTLWEELFDDDED